MLPKHSEFIALERINGKEIFQQNQSFYFADMNLIHELLLMYDD